jgi:hypothetical protein
MNQAHVIAFRETHSFIPPDAFKRRGMILNACGRQEFIRSAVGVCQPGSAPVLAPALGTALQPSTSDQGRSGTGRDLPSIPWLWLRLRLRAPLLILQPPTMGTTHLPESSYPFLSFPFLSIPWLWLRLRPPPLRLKLKLKLKLRAGMYSRRSE